MPIGLIAAGLVAAGVGIASFVAASSDRGREQEALEQLDHLQSEQADLEAEIADTRNATATAEADTAALRDDIAAVRSETDLLSDSLDTAAASLDQVRSAVWDVYDEVARFVRLDDRVSRALDDAVALGNRRQVEAMTSTVEEIRSDDVSQFEALVGDIDAAIAATEGLLAANGADFDITEDFDGAVAGWEPGFSSNGEAQPTAGGYEITALDDGYLMWGMSPYLIPDVAIEVTATPIAAAEDGFFSYGVLCRAAQTTYLGGYLFTIDGNGEYQVGWFEPPGDFVNLLNRVGRNSAINQGLEENRIEVVCDGSDLSFSVNGAVLWEGSDENLTDGSIALSAITYSDVPVTVRFDDLRLTGTGGGR